MSLMMNFFTLALSVHATIWALLCRPLASLCISLQLFSLHTQLSLKLQALCSGEPLFCFHLRTVVLRRRWLRHLARMQGRYVACVPQLFSSGHIEARKKSVVARLSPYPQHLAVPKKKKGQHQGKYRRWEPQTATVQTDSLASLTNHGFNALSSMWNHRSRSKHASRGSRKQLQCNPTLWQA